MAAQSINVDGLSAELTAATVEWRDGDGPVSIPLDRITGAGLDLVYGRGHLVRLRVEVATEPGGPPTVHAAEVPRKEGQSFADALALRLDALATPDPAGSASGAGGSAAGHASTSDGPVRWWHQYTPAQRYFAAMGTLAALNAVPLFVLGEPGHAVLGFFSLLPWGIGGMLVYFAGELLLSTAEILGRGVKVRARYVRTDDGRMRRSGIERHHVYEYVDAEGERHEFKGPGRTSTEAEPFPEITVRRVPGKRHVQQSSRGIVGDVVLGGVLGVIGLAFCAAGAVLLPGMLVFAVSGVTAVFGVPL